MIYVMSDLHGEYEKYMAMLEKINFQDDDTLYILGDVIDRGNHSVEILKDMSVRPNVYPTLGNHEVMALEVLNKLNVEITAENYAHHLDEAFMQSIIEWQLNGGDKTLAEFQKLPAQERLDLLDYLQDFTYYETVDTASLSFILVHAGLGNFSPHKKLAEYSITELAFMRCDPEYQYFNDPSIYIISGHTPTLALTGKPEIYCSHHNICIDCGAVFASGRLACLCLDTMEAFYV